LFPLVYERIKASKIGVEKNHGSKSSSQMCTKKTIFTFYLWLLQVYVYSFLFSVSLFVSLHISLILFSLFFVLLILFIQIFIGLSHNSWWVRSFFSFPFNFVIVFIEIEGFRVLDALKNVCFYRCWLDNQLSDGLFCNLLLAELSFGCNFFDFDNYHNKNNFVKSDNLISKILHYSFSFTYLGSYFYQSSYRGKFRHFQSWLTHRSSI
jgi:hypothetical protein